MMKLAVILFMVPPLVLGLATTHPVSRPATQAVVGENTPTQVAQDLLQGLEVFLRQEHADRRAADRTLVSLSAWVSRRPMDTLLGFAGLKASEVGPEKLGQVRKDILGSWAAVINFYTGHIEYARMTLRTPPVTEPGEPPAAQVLFPAVSPDFPQPVRILVACIQENGAWKVDYVSLRPAR